MTTAKARQKSQWFSDNTLSVVHLTPAKGINGIHLMAFFGLVPAHYREYSQMNESLHEENEPREENGYLKFVRGLLVPQSTSFGLL